MNKNIKDMTIAFGIGIILTIAISMIGPNTYEAITEDTTYKNITVRQVHTLIATHIENNELNIKPGTEEYVLYLTDMLMLGVDEELLNEPYYYDVIMIYASHYVTEFPQIDSANIIAKLGLYDDIPKTMINKKISELVGDEDTTIEHVEVGVL